MTTLGKMALIPRVLYYSPIVDKPGIASSEIAVGQEIKPGLRTPRGSDRVPMTNIDEANLVSSYVATHHGSIDRIANLHAPVIDIDHGDPALLVTQVGEWYRDNIGVVAEANDFVVIPSTTQDHFHLYVELPLDWELYEKLLGHLLDLGWIEKGYFGANVARGATFVRKPGHLKPPPFTLDGLSV